MMSLHTRALNIDQDAASRLATAYTGYGEASRSQADALRSDLGPRTEDVGTVHRGGERQLKARIEQARLVAASAFCIGASYYALFDTIAAKAVYWAAARAYRDLGMSYGAILAICGEDWRLEEQYWQEITENDSAVELAPQNAAPMMLVAADMLVRDDESARKAFSIINLSEPMAGALIGSAQLRMGSYHALAVEAWSLSRGDVARLPLTATTDFLTAWGHRLALAQLDRFHWSHVHPHLLPIEPEVLAAAIVVVKAAHRAKIDISQTMEELHVPPPAMVPVAVADELIRRSGYIEATDDPVILKLVARRGRT